MESYEGYIDIVFWLLRDIKNDSIAGIKYCCDDLNVRVTQDPISDQDRKCAEILLAIMGFSRKQLQIKQLQIKTKTDSGKDIFENIEL